jgi:nicotinamide riboside transporter PnuC
MRGKVVRLDRRWWPLWVLLGIVAVVLLLTVGVVAAVVLIVIRILGGVLRWFTGGTAKRPGSGLARFP